MDTRKPGKKISLVPIGLGLAQTQLAGKINGKQKSISGYETVKNSKNRDSDHFSNRARV